jgi:hypothetical protein
MNAITFIQELKNYLDIKQLAKLSVLNKEYKDAVSFYMPQQIIKHIKSKHDICIEHLCNSQINMIEFSNLLDNLVYIRDRKPNQRYKHLLRLDKLFNVNASLNDASLSEASEHDAQESTMHVLNALYMYTYKYCNYEHQLYTCTDLLEIIGNLYIDYISKANKNAKHAKLFKRIFISKDRKFNDDIIYHCHIAKFSILSFYTLFVKIADKNLKKLDTYINSVDWNISNTCIQQCSSFMHIFVFFANTIQYITKKNTIQYKSRIIYITMTYIYDIFERKINPVLHVPHFIMLCIKKSNEFNDELLIYDIKPQAFKTIFKNTMQKFDFLLE